MLDGFGDPVTTLTLADGSYQFGGLPPGDYCVVQDQPSGYVSVSDTDGPNDNVIGNVTPITVTAGATSGGNDFIEIELGTISGTVLTDDDNNGSGDSPLSGVVINLLDGSGNPVLDGFGSPIQVATDASDSISSPSCPPAPTAFRKTNPPDTAASRTSMARTTT
ncbi:MAG: SdrD B-like domain-containing protein [Thermomicrobiales bacterium]